MTSSATNICGSPVRLHPRMVAESCGVRVGDSRSTPGKDSDESGRKDFRCEITDSEGQTPELSHWGQEGRPAGLAEQNVSVVWAAGDTAFYAVRIHAHTDQILDSICTKPWPLLTHTGTACAQRVFQVE